MQPELQTTELRNLLHRFQAGDGSALDELIRRAASRLERMARSMLRRYPSVRQHEQTADVVQETVLSLIGALRQINFASTREFYGLAAEHIRRRLLDLARRHRRGNQVPLDHAAGESGQIPAPESEDDLDRWQALHEAVAALPPDQREAFSLRFYHGWGMQEVADLLQISTRTVTRLWLRAQVALGAKLGAPLPEEKDGNDPQP